MPMLISSHEYATNPKLRAIQLQAESDWADQGAEDRDDDGQQFYWERCTRCGLAFKSYRGETVCEGCQ